MKGTRRLIFCLLLLTVLASCKNESLDFGSAPIASYYPLEVGKYIIYRLDSTVYLPFGTSSVIRSYQVKYLNDARITDNLGRTAFRIIRYIRKNPADAWAADASFMAINNGKQAEFVENNMRFIKLTLPLQDGTSWKGNSYIDTYSINSTVRYLDGWDYVMDSVGFPSAVGDLVFEKTLRVNQRDEVLGDPSDPTAFSEINFSVEKYAAGIGMIYRKFFHSEYQPGGNGFFADGSYGVEYSIIDHN